MDLINIFLILIVLVFANIIGSTIGFGDSLIFISITAFFINIRVAIVMMAFWSALLSLLNAVRYRAFFDRKFIGRYVIPAVIGTILGASLIVVAPTEWLQLLLALFTMIYVIAKGTEMVKERKMRFQDPETIVIVKRSMSSISPPIFYAGSFTFGFISGLLGAGGPINVILLERTGHVRESFIENFAIASLIAGSIKLVLYTWNGLFPLDLIWLLALGLGLIYLSTMLGHWITPKIPEKKFQVLVLLLLVIISIRLILSALSSLL